MKCSLKTTEPLHNTHSTKLSGSAMQTVCSTRYSLSVHAKLFTDMQIKGQNILLFVTKAVHLRFPNKRTLCTKNSVWTKCHTESVMLRIK